MRIRLLGLPAVLIVIAHGCAEQSDGAIAEPETAGRGGKAGASGAGGKAGSTSGGKGGTPPTGGSGGSSNGGTSSTDGGSAQGGDPSGGGGDPTGGGGDPTGGGGDPTGGGGEGGDGPIIGAGGGCHQMDAPISGISVRYDADATGNSYTISGEIRVHNEGPNTINLAEVVLRYYFTNEVTANLIPDINWAYYVPNAGGGQTDIPTNKITYSAIMMDAGCATGAATHYLEFEFAGDIGTLTPENHMKFSFDITNLDSQMFLQDGDYSYSSVQTTASDWDKIVILNSSGVVWGSEP